MTLASGLSLLTRRVLVQKRAPLEGLHKRTYYKPGRCRRLTVCTVKGEGGPIAYWPLGRRTVRGALCLGHSIWKAEPIPLLPLHSNACYKPRRCRHLTVSQSHLSHLSWPSPCAGPASIWVIQYFRSCAMSSVSRYFFMSPCMLSLHLFLGRPRLLLPETSSLSDFAQMWLGSRLKQWPNHFSLLFSRKVWRSHNNACYKSGRGRHLRH